MPDNALKRLINMHKPASWIIAILESAQEYIGEGRNDPGWFHPSSFGNECDAFLAFRFLGAPAVEVITARTQRIYDYGNIRESFLRKYLKNAGISLIQNETDRQIVIPHLRIRGELDDWVKNPVTGRKYVIDYKTMRDDYWQNLDTVVRSHHLQVHPYQYGKQTYEAFVLYENKNDQNLKAMPANFDNNIWRNEFELRIERILTGLEYNLVYRNPVRCSNCPFFANGVCTQNDIAGLKERSGLYS